MFHFRYFGFVGFVSLAISFVVLKTTLWYIFSNATCTSNGSRQWCIGNIEPFQGSALGSTPS